MHVEITPVQIQQFVRDRFPQAKIEKNFATVLCPFHDDHTPSGRISLEHGGYNCFSCGITGSFWKLAQEVLRCDFKTARDAVIGKAEPKWIERIFPFTDLDGALRYQVLRYEHPVTGKKRPEKPYLQRRSDGAGGWIWNLKGVQPLLYRFADIISAETVFIPEGEHKVDLLRAWSLVATCNSGGACVAWSSSEKRWVPKATWLEEFNGFFSKKNIVLLPDNDEDGKGQAHCEYLAAQIRPVARSVKIVKLPGLPPKGDIKEWKDAGHTKEQFLELVATAIPWQPKSPENHASSNGHSDSARFWIAEDGVCTTVFNKETKEFDDIIICSPLTVAATTRNENGEDWGRLLEWQDIDGRKHSWSMPMSLLAGSGEDFRRVLLGGGLEITPSQLARIKLTEYVQSARPEKSAVSVTKIGWHGDVFVLPDATIDGKAADAEPEQLYFYQPPQETSHNIRVHGLAEEWRDYIGKVCSGNSRLVLAVSCAFAAPLLALTDSESGGFHFYGDSSKGKSTAQTVAGSVWGGGSEKGYLESWRTTANGLEIFAEIHNDGLGCLDEIGQIEARQLGEAVYMLANGQGKGRMTKNVGSRKRLTWSMLFLSSGNVTLAQHMGEAGQAVHTALEVRLISITADAGARMGMFEKIHDFPDSKAFAEYLVSSAYKCYGAPIREFLKQLAPNRFKIAGKIRERMETFARDAIPSTAPSEIRRAGRRFGLCVAAGELATEWGLTGWSMNEVAPMIKKCLSDWMETREPSDSDRGVRAVKQFLEMHGASRFQDIKAMENDRVINRAGYKKFWEGDDHTEFCFLPEVFRAEVCRGFNPSAVLEVLKEKGFLLTGDKERPSTVIRVPGVGSTRVYRISSSILE